MIPHLKSRRFATRVALALLALLGAACAPEAGNSPHVILISIDTLRADHVGYTGYRPGGVNPTPFIDRLAAEGVVFQNVYSTSSWTLPAHHALMTGLPDALHGMVADRVPANPELTTLAEVFRDRGYATGGFFSGPYLHGFFGFDRGFDRYRSCMGESSVYDEADRWDALTPQQIGERRLADNRRAHRDVSSERVVLNALKFVEEQQGKPLFLFLHFFDVHHDFIPPHRFGKRFDPDYEGWVDGRDIDGNPRYHPGMHPDDLGHLKALYDGEIAWVDHNLGLFFEALHDRDPEFVKNCLVAITSDHGEEFFEHGRLGHRKNLGNVCLHVPLVIRPPKGNTDPPRATQDPSGALVNDAAGLYDLFPTLLELAGLPAPDSIYGRSLAPLLRGETLPPRPVLSELTRIEPDLAREGVFERFTSSILLPYKLVRVQRRRWDPSSPIDFTGEVVSERYALYDLAKDPGETTDLLDTSEKLTGNMKKVYLAEVRHLKRLSERIASREPGAARDLSAELIRQLEELGY